MDHTPRLSLPFIMPSQAQKHITHNEALQALDALVQPIVESRSITAPPTSPVQGEAYLVPSGATGAWSGHANEIVAFQSGAWQFYDPAEGWQVFVKADGSFRVFVDGAWAVFAALGASLPRLGIQTTADATNRLAVSAEASLFTHAGNGHQLKINKAVSTDTASLLYQSTWSGRAELGLAGDDNWRLKVSADGTNWHSAFHVDAGSGDTRFSARVLPAADNAITLGASGARWSAIWSATGTIQTSDARYKTDISPSDLGLDFICALRPVKYRFSSGDTRTHYGLVAQEVLAVLNGSDFAGHVLADPDNAESEQGLRYDSFIAPLIAATQALADKVERLEATLAAK
jgi:hypothetical protein